MIDKRCMHSSRTFTPSTRRGDLHNRPSRVDEVPTRSWGRGAGSVAKPRRLPRGTLSRSDIEQIAARTISSTVAETNIWQERLVSSLRNSLGIRDGRKPWPLRHGSASHQCPENDRVHCTSESRVDRAYDELDQLLLHRHIKGSSEELESKIQSAWAKLHALQEEAGSHIRAELDATVEFSPDMLQSMLTDVRKKLQDNER